MSRVEGERMLNHCETSPMIRSRNDLLRENILVGEQDVC
jgi:hypothetical protein